MNLQDLFDFNHSSRLQEVFDTEIEIEWENLSKGEHALFKYGEHVFVIQIVPIHLPLKELKGMNIVEASFYRKDLDGEASFSTTDEYEVPVKVYGGVMNAFADKFVAFDGMYFEADRRHSKSQKQFAAKTRLYSFMADRVAKKAHAIMYTAKSSSISKFLVTTTKLQNSDYTNPVQEGQSLPEDKVKRI